jgi:riboflavin synthase
LFTGIVQSIGVVQAVEPVQGDVRLFIEAAGMDLGGLRTGDSVSVSGVCLTAIGPTRTRFAADVSRETLGLTTLGSVAAGDAVNLETALRAGDPLGGHLVSGHVDGIAEVASLHGDARSTRAVFRCQPALSRYIARKGSVAIDGVSLTVNGVAGSEFDVNLIPHTQAVTTLGRLAPGSRVNLEIDQVARYVERLLAAQIDRSE